MISDLLILFVYVLVGKTLLHFFLRWLRLSNKKQQKSSLKACVVKGNFYFHIYPTNTQQQNNI